MGRLFRSEEMSLLQLFIQKDVAYDTADELGKLGIVQFRDMNPDMTSFARPYVNDVKRADEMERRLRFIIEEVKDAELLGDKEQIITKLTLQEHDAPTRRQVDEMEKSLVENERELRQSKVACDGLARDLAQLQEFRFVIEEASLLLQSAPLLGSGTHGAAGVDYDFLASSEAPSPIAGTDLATPLLAPGSPAPAARTAVVVGDAETGGVRTGTGALYGFIAGIIGADRLTMFERVLWRAMRGNYYIRTSKTAVATVDPEALDYRMKTAFVVFFQGEFSRDKILKICNGYGANVYSCPDSPEERLARVEALSARVREVEQVHRQSYEARKQKMSVLLEVPPHPSVEGVFGSSIDRWAVHLRKYKYLLHTLNLFNFDASRKCLIAETWAPTGSIASVEESCRRAALRCGALVPTTISRVRTKEEPPTYFKLNKFNTVFQDIVHSYGVATYREVNPAVFAAITFPFLFAVMYGDWGHGLLMMMFAIYLIYNEKKLGSQKLIDIVEMLFGGRYVIFLMGLFSIYTGLIYNDVFSNSIDFFGTSWSMPAPGSNSTDMVFSGHAYPFGVDPAWAGNERELNFYNSLKMKMAVSIGVTQMMLGVFLSLFNHPYFKQSSRNKRYTFSSFLTSHDLWLRFMPRFLFLGGVFGYMILMILVKWSEPWDKISPPNLIATMIGLMLSPTSLVDSELFPYQLELQQLIVVVAIVCVPWMLVPKPILEWKEHEKELVRTGGHLDTNKNYSITDDPAWPLSSHPMETRDVAHDEKFSDVFIHSIIHTIEFVLGCVSHTASYLRLWALSLAHAELSKVFWEMVLGLGLKSGNFIVIFATFFMWACASVGVLLVMEALSAFLHALRLHWVEFQDKFYQAEGHGFVPFNYESLVVGSY